LFRDFYFEGVGILWNSASKAQAGETKRSVNQSRTNEGMGSSRADCICLFCPRLSTSACMDVLKGINHKPLLCLCRNLVRLQCSTVQEEGRRKRTIEKGERKGGVGRTDRISLDRTQRMGRNGTHGAIEANSPHPPRLALSAQPDRQQLLLE